MAFYKKSISQPVSYMPSLERVGFLIKDFFSYSRKNTVQLTQNSKLAIWNVQIHMSHSKFKLEKQFFWKQPNVNWEEYVKTLYSYYHSHYKDQYHYVSLWCHYKYWLIIEACFKNEKMNFKATQNSTERKIKGNIQGAIFYP